MLRTSSTRVIRRCFSTEATPAAAAAPAKKNGSSLGQRFAAFFVGAAVGGAGAIYQIRQDLLVSNGELQKELAALKGDVVEANARLAQRVAQLEKSSK
ncbi:hypothetical protein H257_11971 [Aphanomyces astaci]|uniref:Uncharacterized protein n=1 Tax=Aphanomyces astaci TaxID=112090 RepID=W4G2K1_APHAT|nr:hypothetical protein H257_11971 [Aphanomyces astaci]ETV73153.1 hypothetical protein H257_11971 [Aphanomyces astaci]RQM27120.1 hypothetical protein B5M09_006576 [Aphanomyces astaci]|eukprot:XP_009837358.1 hypothetical protein H257_11971 [Aphanomyces astaci]